MNATSDIDFETPTPAPAAKRSRATVPPGGQPEDTTLRTITPLAPNKVTLTQFVNNSFTVYAHSSLSVDDLVNPALWVVASKDFAVNDEIRVIQNERWTLLLVTKVGVGGINLSVLLSTAVAMPDAFAPAQLPAGYEIQVSQSGELARFAVIRQSDGVQINKNLDHKTYEAARAWLTTHSIFRTNNAPTRRER